MTCGKLPTVKKKWNFNVLRKGMDHGTLHVKQEIPLFNVFSCTNRLRQKKNTEQHKRIKTKHLKELCEGWVFSLVFERSSWVL